MPIYTKNGDKGFTSILSGLRVRKSDSLIDCLGDVDELNSLLGVLLAELKDDKNDISIRSKIKNQQFNLLKAGAVLAANHNEKLLQDKDVITDLDVVNLENEIDEWQKGLPELKNFILPGGNKAAALAHHARVVCRRTERSLVKLDSDDDKYMAVLLKYFNRLSDWLFTLARELNEGKDIVWEG